MEKLKALWAKLCTAFKTVYNMVKAKFVNDGKLTSLAKKVMVIVSIVIIAVITIALLPAKEKPQIKEVIESPTKEEIKTASIVVTEEKVTKVSGKEKISSGKTTSSQNTSDITSQDTIVKIPVTGETTTTYTDQKTGNEIAQATHPVTGETMVDLKNNEVATTTIIEDTVTKAYVIEVPKPKLWEAGFYIGGKVGDDDAWIAGAYGQRDFIIRETKYVDFYTFARLSIEKELTSDEDSQAVGVIGVKVKF